MEKNIKYKYKLNANENTIKIINQNKEIIIKELLTIINKEVIPVTQSELFETINGLSREKSKELEISLIKKEKFKAIEGKLEEKKTLEEKIFKLNLAIKNYKRKLLMQEHYLNNDSSLGEINQQIVIPISKVQVLKKLKKKIQSNEVNEINTVYYLFGNLLFSIVEKEKDSYEVEISIKFNYEGVNEDREVYIFYSILVSLLLLAILKQVKNCNYILFGKKEKLEFIRNLTKEELRKTLNKQNFYNSYLGRRNSFLLAFFEKHSFNRILKLQLKAQESLLEKERNKQEKNFIFENLRTGILEIILEK